MGTLRAILSSFLQKNLFPFDFLLEIHSCFLFYINRNNLCLQFSEFLGLSYLTSLCLKKNAGITAEGLKALSKLVNLVNLDLERCSNIRGGLVHMRGGLYISYLI